MITINRNRKNYYCILIFLLFYTNFFNIINIPISSHLYNVFLWILALMNFAISFLYTKGKIGKEVTFAVPYLIYIYTTQIIICYYSVYQYNQSFSNVLKCAGYYSYLLLYFGVMIAIKEIGFGKMLQFFNTIAAVCILVILLHAIFFNIFGIRLFQIRGIGIRDGRMRNSLGVFACIFFAYTTANIVYQKQKLKNIIWLIIGLIALFYTDMTRIKELAVILEIGCIYFFSNYSKKQKINKILILLLGIFIVIIFKDSFQNLFNMFSVDRTVNSNANSTIARLYAMEYFSKFTEKNPLMGMGWIFPSNNRLRNIWSGPQNIAFFDDLGIIGQYYRLGIIGLISYIVLILRMLYIIVKYKKSDIYKACLIGLFIYAIITAVSLNIFDFQRIVLVPIYMAIFEYAHRNKNKLEGDLKV